jgi:hypothetical protein
MKLYHASIEDRKQELDVNCIDFGINEKVSKAKLIDFIDEKYCGKMKKVVFIAMIGSDTSDYFITDSHMKVQNYFLNSPYIAASYFLFEEQTYEDAFEYCKDHCEVHELGLN